MPCDFSLERKFWTQGFSLIAGVDEAGRGPLAGPVVAAAVVLPADFSLAGVDDSKKLIPAAREELFGALTRFSGCISYGIGVSESEEIDRINILQATFRAMERAINALTVKPEHILVDGLHAPTFNCPYRAIVDGDAKSISIAAASIIAKVTRDRIMVNWHESFPKYDFISNKGYATAAHLEQLQSLGPCPIHRRSFSPVSQTVFPFFRSSRSVQTKRNASPASGKTRGKSCSEIPPQ
ncbi:MAG: ribonuclease HII [Verrucomicrobia bacterium]|nr:ribonuclease HII [Verrucomicrobiota bacterium]